MILAIIGGALALFIFGFLGIIGFRDARTRTARERCLPVSDYLRSLPGLITEGATAGNLKGAIRLLPQGGDSANLNHWITIRWCPADKGLELVVPESAPQHSRICAAALHYRGEHSLVVLALQPS